MQKENRVKIKSLGHVVVRVSNLSRSEAFYQDVLGLNVCAHYTRNGANMAFFTLGNHHDFAISERPELDTRKGSGLDHVAFKIGDSLDDLVDAKRRMEAHGVAIHPVDHVVTKSIYIEDPDGNGVELYVDTSDAWREDPGLIANSSPLDL